MFSDRELDAYAYADAALVAILRLLVACGDGRYGGERPPFDRVLTHEGVEAVHELAQRCQRLPLFGFGTEWEGRAETSYRDHRCTIDPLWRYVEEYGVELLLREIADRAPRLLRSM